MRKGEIYELKIEDLSHDGWGVGRANNMVVFVSGAIPQDIVRAQIVKCKKRYAYGELLQIVKPSPMRIESDCEHFLDCGGCNLRNIRYEAELAYKTQRVKKALQKIGFIEDISLVSDCISCQPSDYYRNKAEFCLDLQDDEVVVGFKSSKSHKIVDISACKLQMTKINQTIEKLKTILSEYKKFLGDDGLHHIILRQSDFTGQIMVVLVSGYPDHLWAMKPVLELADGIKEIASVHYAVSPKHSGWNFSGTTQLLYGEEKIAEKIGHIKINISPASFLQINTKQASILYSVALDFADPNPRDILADLYCGAGSIGLYMADRFASVIGVEISESAVGDGRDNAELNNIDNIQFKLGLVEDLIFDISKMDEKPDIAVIDPPRIGCDKEFLKVLSSMAVDKIVYISCDPETMARDIAILADLGYELVKAQPVDMFPRTAHIECVALLSRHAESRK